MDNNFLANVNFKKAASDIIRRVSECTPLPCVDRRTTVNPADSDIFSDLPSIVPATGNMKVGLLPQSGAQRLHGLRGDLNHHPI